MRQRGLEPPRYCYRQPLKLVRLPIPPLPHEGSKTILAATHAADNQIKCSLTFSGVQVQEPAAVAVVPAGNLSLAQALPGPVLRAS